MANSVTSTILVDGPKHCVVRFEGVLDTSDLASTTVVDPATLSPIDPATGALPTRLTLQKITQYTIEDLLSVNLFWDATTPVRLEELVGRGKADYHRFGGIKNTAGTYASSGVFTPAAGFTGKVTATTQGWGAGTSPLSFALVLEFTKSL